MRIVFADTFYFLALLGQRDRAHVAANAFNETFHGRVVTSDWVLLELADAMAVVQKRKHFVDFYRFIAANTSYEIVRPSSADFDAGLTLFRDRQDKEWTLTGCISFTIMQRLGITDALTGDRHFTQAGYTVLLPRSEI